MVEPRGRAEALAGAAAHRDAVLLNRQRVGPAAIRRAEQAMAKLSLGEKSTTSRSIAGICSALRNTGIFFVVACALGMVLWATQGKLDVGLDSKAAWSYIFGGGVRPGAFDGGGFAFVVGILGVISFTLSVVINQAAKGALGPVRGMQGNQLERHRATLGCGTVGCDRCRNMGF